MHTDPPVLDTLSDPARSTRCSFECLTTSLPACRASRLMVKMQWLREEAWFMGVSEMVRLVSPRNSCRARVQQEHRKPAWARVGGGCNRGAASDSRCVMLLASYCGCGGHTAAAASWAQSAQQHLLASSGSCQHKPGLHPLWWLSTAHSATCMLSLGDAAGGH